MNALVHGGYAVPELAELAELAREPRRRTWCKPTCSWSAPPTHRTGWPRSAIAEAAKVEYMSDGCELAA